MDAIKPSISAAGYAKALQEYGHKPSRIVEELVANSYDADATIVLIVHSDREITVIDNGSGIENDQFPKLLDLGSGTKLGSHESDRKRSYLGSFGFGIKSTINISKSLRISTITSKYRLSSEIDVAELEKNGFGKQPAWPGFPVVSEPRKSADITGTIVSLRLNSQLSPDDLLEISASLYNLPRARDFAVYLVPASKVDKQFSNGDFSSIASIATIESKHSKSKITGRLDIGSPKTVSCAFPGSDSIDIAVWCHGLDSNMKVPSLGAFAGVYVKVDGRVLKRNFQGEKSLDGVSKFPKFKHGMRIEVPIDWVKQQISLGRDGLQFSNDSSKKKFESELKTAVSAAVKPFAKLLESRKAQKFSKAAKLRLKKAQERIEKKQTIPALAGGGFAYKPTDDYEMALLVANPVVMKRINPTWALMDFNGQLDFDCLFYDKSTTNYLNVELEPTLKGILTQGVLENTHAIVTWTRGNWPVRKSLKGKRGHFELIELKGVRGHYKLLVKATAKAKEPKQLLEVYCLEEILEQ